MQDIYESWYIALICHYEIRPGLRELRVQLEQDSNGKGYQTGNLVWHCGISVNKMSFEKLEIASGSFSVCEPEAAWGTSEGDPVNMPVVAFILWNRGRMPGHQNALLHRDPVVVTGK
jgi:hypothetical protein